MTTNNSKLHSLVLVGAFVLALPFSAWAGTVQQVKNGKVLMSLDGEEASVGDEFYVVNSSGKKTAIVQITQVKNGKALGMITKGKAAPNDSTELKGSGGGGMESSGGGGGKAFIRSNMKKFGINIKMMMNAITTKQQDNSTPPLQEDVAMKGSNMGLMGTLDYPLSPMLIGRGTVAYEMLDIAGTATRNVCGGKTSTACDAKITYLSFGGYARYDIIKSAFNLWVGAGGTLKIPMSKSSTSLTEGDIKMANTIAFTAGVDYQMNNKYFIPVSFEYHYSLNKSDTVPTIDQIAIQGGFGFLF